MKQVLTPIANRQCPALCFILKQVNEFIDLQATLLGLVALKWSYTAKFVHSLCLFMNCQGCMPIGQVGWILNLDVDAFNGKYVSIWLSS
jgi:hypothetical protein